MVSYRAMVVVSEQPGSNWGLFDCFNNSDGYSSPACFPYFAWAENSLRSVGLVSLGFQQSCSF